jgi:hypothetical protein
VIQYFCYCVIQKGLARFKKLLALSISFKRMAGVFERTPGAPEKITLTIRVLSKILLYF